MSKSDCLRKLANEQGKITIAALDHRGSLKQSLHPENPEVTTETEMRDWKIGMVELFKNEVSGILIDPIFGREIIDHSYPCGWMLSMEKTGYRGGKEARETEILENWSVAQAKEMGACGVKLLLYYDPKNKDLAVKQKELAGKIAEESRKQGVAFLLEPLSYNAAADIAKEVLGIVNDLKDVEADIFKFEYPGSREACVEISKLITKPWVLLSAGLEYAKYQEALQIACESGASGFAVGRAVWQEFGNYQGQEREKYFQEIALPRMRELVAIVNQCGKSID